MPRTSRRVKLTDKAVQATKAPARGQIDYFDAGAGLAGFALRVSAQGRERTIVKTWTLLYRVRDTNRLRRLTLGRYPLMSLAEARTKAREALVAVARGEDPAGERKVRREAVTVKEVADAYVKHQSRQVDGQPVSRSWPEKQRMLEKDVVPAWGSRQARDITARDVRELLDAIVDRGAPIAANRTFALIRRMFNWAAAPDRALVPQHHNPCRGMEAPSKERQRDRVLSDDEIRAVWKALEAEDVFNTTLFKLYLLTAQRGGELKGMRRDELDLDAGHWNIPAERAKNGRAHRVPLSPQAVALLRELPQVDGSPFVFASRRATDGHRETVAKAMARIRKASGVDFWPHDLRRTVASHMAALGISRLTIAKVLNHTDRGVTAIYERHSYLPEMTTALNTWAAKLEQIVSDEQKRAKVVALRA